MICCDIYKNIALRSQFCRTAVIRNTLESLKFFPGTEIWIIYQIFCKLYQNTFKQNFSSSKIGLDLTSKNVIRIAGSNQHLAASARNFTAPYVVVKIALLAVFLINSHSVMNVSYNFETSICCRVVSYIKHPPKVRRRILNCQIVL